MYRITVIFSFILILIVFPSWRHTHLNVYKLYQLHGKAQGTTYSIKYVANYQSVNPSSIDSLFSVFEHSLSRYKTSSLLSYLNRYNRKIVIDQHLQYVLQEAIRFQMITAGCFDYRLLSLRQLWGFESSGRIDETSDKEVKKLLAFISGNNIIINDFIVLKSNKKLTIDLDGIAQGYCVDQLAQFIQSKGIEDFIIELGGEVFVSGRDLNNCNWTIGIADAKYVDDRFGVVQIAREGKYAVTSSGSYQQYRKTGNKLISHIIDPRTGYPVQNGVIAVTVMAPTAIEADALDNAFMVMGVNETFNWLKKYPNIGVYMSYIDENGEKADTANSYLKQYMVPNK